MLGERVFEEQWHNRLGHPTMRIVGLHPTIFLLIERSYHLFVKLVKKVKVIDYISRAQILQVLVRNHYN